MFGEVFLSDNYTDAQFEEDFRESYSTAPAITGVVVVTKPSNSKALQAELENVTQEFAAFEPPAAQTNHLLEPVQQSAEQGATDSDQPAQTVEKPWAPGPQTFLWAEEDDSQAVIQFSSGYIEYEGHLSDALPSEFGLEVELNQYNELIHGVRPNCVLDPELPQDSHYFESFWAGKYTEWNDGIDSWSIVTESGEAIDHEDVGFYWGWAAAEDACERQSMAVGIAHPQELPGNIAGVQSFLTEIRAPRGLENLSPIQAQYDVVFNDCAYEVGTDGEIVPKDNAYTPSSWCMGLTDVDFPAGDPYQLLINRDRGWAAPGCFSMYLDAPGGEDAVWEMAC